MPAGDHSPVQHVIDGDRRLKGGARVLGRPFALHERRTYLLL
jgi:hypothetical protein